MIGLLFKRKDGNIATAFALMAGPLMLAGTLAVDSTAMMRQTQHVQNALDTAILAIGAARREGYGGDLSLLGEKVFAGNSGLAASEFTFDYLGTPTAAQAGAYGIDPGQADDYLLATVSFDYDGDFGLMPSRNIERVAGIVPLEDRRFCVLALQETGEAITFTGNSDLSFEHCDVVSNAAIELAGNFELKAHCMRAADLIEARGNMGYDLACGEPEENAGQTVDPYGDLALPDPDEAPLPENENGKFSGNGSLVYEPALYDDLDLSGNLDIELKPGNYFVMGDLKINGNAEIAGHGVTFFLGPEAEVTINGNSDYDLTAPTTGPWAGFLFVGLEGHGSKLKINGNSDARLSGTIYLPGSSIEYTGNSDTANTCVSLVALTIKFTGNTDIASDCSAYDGASEVSFRLAL